MASTYVTDEAETVKAGGGFGPQTFIQALFTAIRTAQAQSPRPLPLGDSMSNAMACAEGVEK